LRIVASISSALKLFAITYLAFASITLVYKCIPR
jgi:hypothetical protein